VSTRENVERKNCAQLASGVLELRMWKTWWPCRQFHNM
jgi:hypothetical protein